MKHPIPLLTPGRTARVVNALTRWNESLTADDLHQKYCKMSVSPFVFYRGTAHIYWADFAGDWRQYRFGCRRTRTWLQGDAHAENMGAFNDQTGELVYGLNDFDESLIGDYQYDLWRFAISLVLVARRNGGFSGDDKAAVIDALSGAYLDAMASYAGNDKALGRTFTAGDTSGLLRDFLEETAGDKTRKKMLKKWTDKDDGARRFDMSSAKLSPASKFEQADIRAAMAGYGETLSGSVEYDPETFAVVDIARRLSAGTGSLGTPRYYVLIQGKGEGTKGNRILDVKRQGRPSAYDYLTPEERVDYDRTYRNDAQRQAVAYEALARHPDAFLGWMKLHNGYYSVRERSPFKETFPTESLTTAAAFVEMAAVWAEVMATDHCRAVRGLRVDGKRYDLAREVTKRTKGRAARRDFLAMVRDYAFEYANQVEADHLAFLEEIEPDDCAEFV